MRQEDLQALIEKLELTGEQAQQILDLVHSFQASRGSEVTFDLGDGALDQPQRPPSSLTALLELSESLDEELPSEPSKLGRYTDLGLLGVGGTGEVRKVRDEDLRRTLAMKIIRPKLLRRRGVVKRFIEEAQIGAQLQHPNILPIHEIGRLPDGRCYFTMKQIQGTEFSKQIRAVHEVSDEDSWRPASDGTTFRDLVHTFHTVCVTVAYAHSKGVVHRDLKPGNILVGDFREVLVVDWGLAKVMGREHPSEPDEAVETDRSVTDVLTTRLGTIVGTPCFMSPEQAQGLTDQIGFASDIYSLGAILYELLSGRHPYFGRSAADVLLQVRRSPPISLRTISLDADLDTEETSAESDASKPAPLRELSPTLPERLAQICERAMQREIEDRYPSAEEMAHAVLSWLEGAEKRDKAMKEVETAELSLQQALEQDRVAEARWSEANTLLEREGASSAPAWLLWSEYRSAEAEARQLRRTYRQQLHGALVHDPGLEEAHRPLAELRIKEMVEASALGDLSAREVHSQQLVQHLQLLPMSVRTTLEERLSQQSADLITGQRSRRGALVGRHEKRKAIVEQMLGGARLISLVGTPGVGKTRLALELAQDLRTHTTSTLFCDLTEARDELGVIRQVSRAMDVRLRDSAPLEHLTELLGQQPTLLVLDNLEQVAEAAGTICQGWMEELPELRILATGRTRLGVPAETTVAVTPLTLLESAELFARRGQTADRRFALQEDNREQVLDLVRKLDGLPLAIELAAARLNVFSLEELEQRLSERFSLLRSRGRDAQALEGALDWSWDLLEPWAKAALSQASIFHGGFNLEAAESVIDVTGRNSPPMFDILGELSDNSLLRKDQARDGSVRYGMLECIRAYCSAKLATSGQVEQGLSGPEALTSTQQRHAAHFAQMGAPEYLDALDGFGSADRWVALFHELDNLVAAIGYGTTETAPRCCIAALRILGMKGPVSLGVDIATRALELPKLPRRLRMQLEIERSKCLRICGRMREARALVRETVTARTRKRKKKRKTRAVEADGLKHGSLASEAHHKATEAQPNLQELHPTISLDSEPESTEEVELTILEADRLLELGILEAHQANHDEAVKCYQAALAIYRRQAHPLGEGKVLNGLANVYSEQGRLDDAIEHYQGAIRIHRDNGQTRYLGQAFGNLGNTYMVQGRFDEAMEQYRRSIQIHRDNQDKASEGITLGNVGLACTNQGRVRDAIGHYQRALDIHVEYGPRRFVGLAYGNLGDALLQLDRRQEAREALSTAVSICDEVNAAACNAFRGSLALLLAREGRSEEAKELLELAEPGIASHRVEHGKLLCKKGQIQLLDDRPDSAATSLAQARSIAETLKVTPHSELAKAIADLEGLMEPEDGDASSTQQDEIALLEAGRLLELGHIDREQSNYEDAQRCYREALAIYRRLGDRNGEGDALNGLGNVAQNMGILPEAIDHYEQALALHRSTGDEPREGRALGNLGTAYTRRGEIEVALEHYRRALVIHRSSGNTYLEGMALGNIGAAHQFNGRFGEALAQFRLALEIHRDIGNRRSEGICLASIGGIHHEEGRFDEALARYRLALDIHREIGDKRNEGIVLGHFGATYLARGEPDAAIEHYRLALDIHQSIGDHNRGTTLGNLAEVFLRIGRWPEAERALREAIVICDEAEPLVAGAFRGSLGYVLARRGCFDEAYRMLEAGEARVRVWTCEHILLLCKKGRVQLLDDLPDAAHASLQEAELLAHSLELRPRSEAGRSMAELQAELDGEIWTGALPETTHDEDLAELEGDRLLQLGTIEYGEANYDAARVCYEQALSIYREHSLRTGEAKTLNGLASIFVDQGQLEEATQYYHLALETLTELRNERLAAAVRGNLGAICHMRGRYDEALEHYQHALQTHRAFGDRQSEATFLGNLGTIQADQGRPGEALEHYQHAIDLQRDTGDKRGEAVFLGNLGDTLAQLERWGEAQEALQGAIALCEEVHPVAGGVFRGSLALLLARQGQLEEAHSLLQTAEPQVDAHLEERGKFLCKAGHVQLLAGQPDAARASLARAQAIAKDLRVNPLSGLARAIAVLEGESSP